MYILTRAKRWMAAVIAILIAIPLVVDPLTADAAKSIQELENSKKQVQGEITKLDSELVDILSDINVLEADIAQNKTDIADAKFELKAAKKAEAKQYEDMKGRMKYMYEHEQKSIFTLLIESGSIAEFLSQIEYAQSVYEYDRALLASYEATTEAVADLKNTLEEERTNLHARESQLEAKKDFLNALISTKKNELKDFDQQLAAAKAEAARRAAEKARREAEARARANAEAVRQRQLAEQRRREEAQRQEQARQQQQQQQQQAQQQTASASDEEEEVDEPVASTYTEPEPEPEPEPEETATVEEDPAPVSSVSGSSVAGYAAQFVGNPYKWGGNSLTSGVDCSGFVVQVYSHFGVNLSGSRSSGALTGVGRAVSYENIQPGDIVCYSGHVAIYAGGGRIVEAQSTKAGITSNRSVTCKPIVAIRRVV